MKHKDKMKWLKEHDPITYSELTDNPTGAGGDDIGCGTTIIIILCIVFGFIICCLIK